MSPKLSDVYAQGRFNECTFSPGDAPGRAVITLRLRRTRAFGQGLVKRLRTPLSLPAPPHDPRRPPSPATPPALAWLDDPDVNPSDWGLPEGPPPDPPPA